MMQSYGNHAANKAFKPVPRQPLNIMSGELAEKTVQGWDIYPGIADAHFHQLKKKPDQTDPCYAT